MMISTSSREKVDVEAKQELGESCGNDEIRKFSKQQAAALTSAAAAAASSSSSRQWSGFRNPRIVRVSRSFGGKDRHSKVCTIRGLRDRRIRLSVPTAIQLYDLQDRLGLSQPSKVIDWLLDATKHDIDKLPPLQLPQGFGQFHQPMLFSHEPNMMPGSQSSLANPFFDANPMELDPSMGAKSYDTAAAAAAEKGKWIKGISTDHDQQDGIGCGKILSFMDRNKDEDSGTVYQDGIGGAAAAAAVNHSASLTGLFNNAMPPPFNPYYHWDPSSLSLSQFGNHGFLSSQTENFLNGNTNSSLALPAAHAPPQLFFCPPPSTMPSLFPTFPPYASTPAAAPPADSSDQSRQINHFQLLSSNSQHVLPNSAMAMKPPFSLNVNAGSHAQNDDESLADDDNTDS